MRQKARPDPTVEYAKDIDPSKMTKEQAEKFVDMVKRSPDFRIRAYLVRIAQKIGRFLCPPKSGQPGG